MSNPIRIALDAARQWISQPGRTERQLAADTGLASRTFGHARHQPKWDPRASTLATILDAMERERGGHGEDTPAQVIAQDECGSEA